MTVRTFRSYRLHTWLPLSSFLLFFCLLSGVVWVDYYNTLTFMHQRTESTLNDMLKQLQMRLEDALAKGEQDEIEREISLLDLQSGTETIALIDAKDMIVAANNPTWKHRSAEALPAFDAARLAGVRTLLRIDMRYERRSQRYLVYLPIRFRSQESAVKAQTEPSPSGREQCEGNINNILPYLFPLTPTLSFMPWVREETELLRQPPQDVGAVYYVYDHSYVESEIWSKLINNYALVWLAIIAALALSWLIWDLLVLRPLQRLLTFVNQIAEGNDEARNPLTGDSELAQLGRILEQNHYALQDTLDTLEMREQLLAVTLQSIGNGLITTDTEGAVTGMNPIAEHLTGWAAEDCLGYPVDKVLQLVDANSGSELSLPIRRVIAARQVVQQNHQVLLCSRNGMTFHVEVSTAPIVGEEGGFFGLILTFNDVSYTCFLRDQLRGEKQYLQHLLDNSATAIYSLLLDPAADTGFRFNYASTRLEDLSGFGIDEWKTQPDLWRSRVHPDDLSEVENAKQHAIEKGQIVSSYRFLHADGRYRWIEDHLTALTNDTGEACELLGGWLDITDSREAELRSQKQEEKIKRLNNFYAILSKINQAIVQTQNEAELFERVCRIAVDLDQVQMAWIGKRDRTTGLIFSVAAAGEQLQYLDGLMISTDPDLPEGQGPSGIAFRENRIVAINDFQHDPLTACWNDEIGRLFGWKSSCGVPILLDRQTYALLNVYAGQIDFFDAEVLELLHELSIDLAFALASYQREAVRRAAEQKMELWAKVFSQNREAVVIADRHARIVSVNQAFVRITGYDELEVIGKNTRQLSSALYTKAIYCGVRKGLKENDFWQGELVEFKKDGIPFTEWLSISVVRDETGAIVNYIAIFTDITQLKSAKQQIEHLAHYDVLTHLPNRLLLKARVDHGIAVAERNKQTFALLFIDLDHFKNINDALGHSVGDQVLVEVGKRLLASIREEDTVARVGGDEFIMQLSNTDWHGAAVVAKKIIAALEQPIHYLHYQLHIQPSIGIGLYPDNGDSFETLSRNADTALYKAKEHGRNQYQFFTPAMQQQTQRRMEVERHLRHALENQELMVYYQPLVNTKTQRINGAEALLRWQHPELGWVSPVEFIPIAEECGLILAVGDWVLEQAIMQARRWHDAGYPVSVAVNLSLAQFRANTLCETVSYFLGKYQLPPRFLELELTESIAMHNVEAAIAITQQLSDLGCEIAIDDFGTGYSSLSYLQRFSLNKLKIDQSFTRGMTDSKESENIVDAIISLAKSLKMKTIAEGVETERQWVIYMQKDCDEIQGFYFSKPVPAHEFDALLARHS